MGVGYISLTRASNRPPLFWRTRARMVSTVRAAETRRAGMPVASTIVSVICSPSASAFRMACSSSVNSLACSLSRISRRAGYRSEPALCSGSCQTGLTIPALPDLWAWRAPPALPADWKAVETGSRRRSLSPLPVEDRGRDSAPAHLHRSRRRWPHPGPADGWCRRWRRRRCWRAPQRHLAPVPAPAGPHSGYRCAPGPRCRQCRVPAR